jgi:hypothetical protein
MLTWREKPYIYQINTWVWLSSLSERYSSPIQLHTVPDEVLDDLAAHHIDAVWLMGIWQRSEEGRLNALKYKHEYRGALPDITDDDVIGSAYAVGDYRVDDRLGGRDGLAVLRAKLRARGLRLLLDFVPNHVATDHPWVLGHPEYLIQGTREDLRDRPDDFFNKRRGRQRMFYFAHGRDPHFPGWSDTAQLNIFSAEMRKAQRDLLLDIADQCDGVRCDMAMLMLDDIFARTWHGYINGRLERPYWQELIGAVKASYPDFVFIAEVYWGREGELLNQGFDYVYDKVLYDRIMEKDVQKLRQHLLAPVAYQRRTLRFIENHDEPRAQASLGARRSYAAATLIATLPGATLFHDGQFDGRRIKLPVQIRRQPHETHDSKLRHFYKMLLAETRDPIYGGDWTLFDIGASGDITHYNLLTYGWYRRDRHDRLIVINLTEHRSRGWVHLRRWGWLAGKRWRLYDVIDGAVYDRAGDEMVERGLYVDLDPYEAHILRFEAL